MLIIAHDHDVIRHDPLFLKVIMFIIRLRHIIIHREHKPVLSAFYRQFPHELYIMLPALCGHKFKIKVEPVHACLKCRGDHLTDQSRPLRSITEHLIGLVIRIDASMEISEHCPDFDPRLMRIRNIIAAGDRGHIPIRIRDAEPGRRDRRHSVRIRQHIFNITVRILI